MEKRVIKKIITEKQEEISKTKLIERAIELEDNCNYVFVGLRRAGKSYLMFQHIQSLIKSEQATIEDILYINFEDERISMMKTEELGDIIESYNEMYDKRPIIYLYEIQNIDGWEKFARRLADSKYQVYVTGSNAKMLSRLQHIVSSTGAKIARNTIADYIGYMKDAYLIFGISNYTDNISERDFAEALFFR